MEWFIENWFILIGVVAIIVCGAILVVDFLGLPTQKQIEKIKQWLLMAVVEAERQLGGKTGKLKLSLVYDWFISRYPMTAKFISFETFSKYVDSALIEMKKLLDSNKVVKEYVEKK